MVNSSLVMPTMLDAPCIGFVALLAEPAGCVVWFLNADFDLVVGFVFAVVAEFHISNIA